MTIIIAAVTGIVLGLVYAKNSWRPEFIEYLMYSMLGGASGLFIGLIIALALPMDLEESKHSLNIETLQDNNSVGGSFFLGSGQIEGKMKYVFYYEEDGFYKMKTIDYNLVKIKYSDEKPKVIVVEQKPIENFINMFAIDNLKETYIIEVPKGTIRNDYNLDAQ